MPIGPMVKLFTAHISNIQHIQRGCLFNFFKTFGPEEGGLLIHGTLWYMFIKSYLCTRKNLDHMNHDFYQRVRDVA